MATRVQGKKVNVGGVEYVVPMGFDTSIYEQEAAIEKQIREGLLGEEQAAAGAIADIQKQEAASIESLRRGAAQALATQRGLVEGGRGLALARGTAGEAATKEKLFRSQFAEQLSGAKQQAAQAKTQRLLEEGKLLQAEKERAAGAAEAYAAVKGVEVKYRGKVWTSEDDYRQMYRELIALANAETNPAKAQVYINAAARANANKMPSEISI